MPAYQALVVEATRDYVGYGSPRSSSAGAPRNPESRPLRSVSLFVGHVCSQVKTITSHQSALCSVLPGQPHLALDHQSVGFERVCVESSNPGICPYSNAIKASVDVETSTRDDPRLRSVPMGHTEYAVVGCKIAVEWA